MKRRELIKLAGLAPFSLAPTPEIPGYGNRQMPFRHGVASGDPLADRVILWTRVDLAGTEEAGVTWEIADTPAFSRPWQRGETVAEARRDGCVKVDVSGLAPGRRYYYRFRVGDRYSPVGRTRTLPIGSVERLAMAVVSCSNYPAGFFNAYRDIARQEHIDVVVHLGDYLYEYAADGYASQSAEALGRVSMPTHELLSLADYRQRHAQYKSDPDLQSVHAAHSMIAIWDDHEVANDAWMNGAENHQPNEGEWIRRKLAAFQAYEEWMPIRPSGLIDGTPLYRDFQFGELASLTMLDTRFAGRERQIDPRPLLEQPEELKSQWAAPNRQLLGLQQEAWLAERLAANADARWQLLGQQVLVSPLLVPALSDVLDADLARQRIGTELVDALLEVGGRKLPLLWDTWDGYPAARARLMGLLDRHASSPVILSGDLHTAMAGNLRTGEGARISAIELVTTSVSSPGFETYLPTRSPGQLEAAFLDENPNLVHMETRYRGWLEVELDHRRCRATWHEVDRIDRPDGVVTKGHRMDCLHRDQGDFGLAMR